jgi:hypothetical protein
MTLKRMSLIIIIPVSSILEILEVSNFNISSYGLKIL